MLVEHNEKIESRKASLRTWYGQTVEIIVDRPLGSTHPKYRQIVYGVNYGYLDSVVGGDGEEQDVYVLDIHEPIEKCSAKIIGAVFRLNDDEDKLLAVAGDKKYTEAEIRQCIDFQEKFFVSEIELDK